ncbi:hypothetical protein BJX96DRAFT_72923 [Aspergillus floccosus]
MPGRSALQGGNAGANITISCTSFPLYSVQSAYRFVQESSPESVGFLHKAGRMRLLSIESPDPTCPHSSQPLGIIV